MDCGRRRHAGGTRGFVGGTRKGIDSGESNIGKEGGMRQ